METALKEMQKYAGGDVIVSTGLLDGKEVRRTQISVDGKKVFYQERVTEGGYEPQDLSVFSDDGRILGIVEFDTVLDEHWLPIVSMHYPAAKEFIGGPWRGDSDFNMRLAAELKPNSELGDANLEQLPDQVKTFLMQALSK